MICALVGVLDWYGLCCCSHGSLLNESSEGSKVGIVGVGTEKGSVGFAKRMFQKIPIHLLKHSRDYVSIVSM